MVLSPRREHHFRLGGCAGRPRVREGGSGGLPELMLGSPKGVLELSGAHFGVSAGSSGAFESVMLPFRVDSALCILFFPYTSWGIPGGTPLSGSAAVGAAQ